MATPLTGIQTIGIATGNWVGPMRGSSLQKNYGKKGQPLSILAVRDKIQSRMNIVVMQVRNSAVLNNVSSLKELKANCASTNAAYTPTQAALKNFAKVLKSAGVDVVKISPDWRTIAVRGKSDTFATVPGQFFDVTLKPGASVAAQSSGLKIQSEGGSIGEGAIGDGLVIVGVGWGAVGVLAVSGVSAVGPSTGALGAIGLGAFGAGAAAESALLLGALLSGPGGWVLIGISVAAIGLGIYLISDSSSGSSSSGTTGTTSLNDSDPDDDDSDGLEAADGTQVYGADDEADATAIANALTAMAPIDPEAIAAAPDVTASSPGAGCPGIEGYQPPVCAGAGGGEGAGTPVCPGVPTPPVCPGSPGTTGCPGAPGDPGAGDPGAGDTGYGGIGFPS